MNENLLRLCRRCHDHVEADRWLVGDLADADKIGARATARMALLIAIRAAHDAAAVKALLNRLSQAPDADRELASVTERYMLDGASEFQRMYRLAQRRRKIRARPPEPE